ncbi:MAG: carbonic anhydrase [Bauldia sp.]
MTSFPDRLHSGYVAFRDGRLTTDRERYRRLAESGQRPEIMIVACCDSRAAPETIFDAAPGELFVHRNVANLIPPYEADGHHHGTSAAIEFAVTRLRVGHLVVMGHGRCGGINAFLTDGALDGTDFIGRWISLLKPAGALIADDPAEGAERQRALEFASIRQSIANLRTFPWIKAMEADGTLALHGAWFDIGTGELFRLEQDEDAFVSVG